MAGRHRPFAASGQHRFNIGFLKGQVNPLGRDHFIQGRVKKTFEDVGGRRGRTVRSHQREVIAPMRDLNTQSTLNLSKMIVELATKARKPLVVIRFKMQLEGRKGFSQGRAAG